MKEEELHIKQCMSLVPVPVTTNQEETQRMKQLKLSCDQALSSNMYKIMKQYSFSQNILKILLCPP